MQSNGWFQAQNGIYSPAQVPWNLYDVVYHFAAKPTAQGTVDMAYITPAEIAQFRLRPAGKKLIFVLKDADDQSVFGKATSPGMISMFVPNIVNFVLSNGYDGVEIDWEAQVNVGQYNDLLSRLRTSLGNSKLLTMDGGDWNSIPSVAVTSQSKLDWVNVMLYDMDNGGSTTWFNSCIMAGNSGQRACNTRMAAFAGVAPSKLIAGVPFYGRKWIGTSSPMTTGTRLDAGIPYQQLILDPNFKQANMQYDAGYQGAYLSVPSPISNFYSYMSVGQMADVGKWAKANNYSGVAGFCLTYDDAAWTLSTAMRAATGTTPIPPIPPVVATYSAPVTQSNGDILFRKLS